MCTEEKHNDYKRWFLIISSAVLLLGGIVFEHFAEREFYEKNQWVLLIWYVAAFMPVGLPVIIEACKSIRQRDIFSEYTLMSIATIGAFCIKQYPEAVAVMLLYSIGELFQDMAVGKARKSITALMDLKPQKQYAVGSTITLKAGERIPQDGILLSEQAYFDTAALTGESVPRAIKNGGEVLAGMIAYDKVVNIKISKPFGESAISRILKMVQDASERKAPTELFIRKFARIYTPAVM
ncbi:MAG: heavy metal translocating P-type ATPase, partial [Bacteroidales bacterium]|nr:heavy metal translocating P-type ATPase [Bacteroidales bacterium]